MISKTSKTIELDVFEIDKLPKGLRTALWRYALKKLLDVPLRHYASKHFNDIDVSSLSPHSFHPKRLPLGVELQGGKDSIVFSTEPLRPAMNYDVALSIPGKTQLEDIDLACRLIEPGDLPQSFSDDEFFFDLDKLPNPLRVRTRRKGDRIRLPKVGTRSVARVMADAKIPRQKRESIPLVYSGSDILLLVGLRRSNIAKIDAQTKRIAGIKISPRRVKVVGNS